MLPSRLIITLISIALALAPTVYASPAPTPQLSDPVWTHFSLQVKTENSEINSLYPWVGYKKGGRACIGCSGIKTVATPRFLGWINNTETKEGWLIPFNPPNILGKLRQTDRPNLYELRIEEDWKYNPKSDLSGHFERSKGKLTWGGQETWHAVPSPEGNGWDIRMLIQPHAAPFMHPNKVRLIPMCFSKIGVVPCVKLID